MLIKDILIQEFEVFVEVKGQIFKIFRIEVFTTLNTVQVVKKIIQIEVFTTFNTEQVFFNVIVPIFAKGQVLCQIAFLI